MSSGTWRPFCLGLNVLSHASLRKPTQCDSSKSHMYHSVEAHLVFNHLRAIFFSERTETYIYILFLLE